MYSYRPVAPGDLELICRHRYEMFKDSGRAEAILVPMTKTFRPWLERKLNSGAYFGWIAEADGKPVAGLGMMVIDWPPHPNHAEDDRRGYVLNVYVEPEHRGCGVAKALMDMAMVAARERDLRFVVLHATAKGRPVYEKLGWKQTPEMGIALSVP